jgi:hypothetical protein
MTDEIMREVHAIKDAIGAKYGKNPGELFKEIQLGEARLKASGVEVLAPPSNPVNLPNTALPARRSLTDTWVGLRHPTHQESILKMCARRRFSGNDHRIRMLARYQETALVTQLPSNPPGLQKFAYKLKLSSVRSHPLPRRKRERSLSGLA